MFKLAALYDKILFFFYGKTSEFQYQQALTHGKQQWHLNSKEIKQAPYFPKMESINA